MKNDYSLDRYYACMENIAEHDKFYRNERAKSVIQSILKKLDSVFFDDDLLSGDQTDIMLKSYYYEEMLLRDDFTELELEEF